MLSGARVRILKLGSMIRVRLNLSFLAQQELGLSSLVKRG